MKIVPVRNDDRGFIGEVQTLVDGILPCFQPTELYITRIDDWFDKKRLGINIVPLDSAKTTTNLRSLNVPWFSRGRITESRYFRRNSRGEFQEHNPRGAKTGFGRKRDRAIRDISSNGLFMWVSGNSAMNGKGSLLIYYTRGGVDTGWYAGFSSAEAWRVAQVQ